MFFSSAFFPRTLMEGWFKTVATYNPISWLIEAARSLVIEGLDVREFLVALGVAGVIFVVGNSLAGLALRRRLAVGA
jgi:ABC-type polysaccharide/polyol phosphate export permease